MKFGIQVPAPNLILKLQGRILKPEEQIEGIDFTSASNSNNPLVVEIQS